MLRYAFLVVLFCESGRQLLGGVMSPSDLGKENLIEVTEVPVLRSDHFVESVGIISFTHVDVKVNVLDESAEFSSLIHHHLSEVDSYLPHLTTSLPLENVNVKLSGQDLETQKSRVTRRVIKEPFDDPPSHQFWLSGFFSFVATRRRFNSH